MMTINEAVPRTNELRIYLPLRFRRTSDNRLRSSLKDVEILLSSIMNRGRKEKGGDVTPERKRRSVDGLE